MSKGWKGAIIRLLVILVIGVILSLGAVSDWFRAPVEEWGAHWEEIINVIKGSPITTTEPPVA